MTWQDPGGNAVPGESPGNGEEPTPAELGATLPPAPPPVPGAAPAGYGSPAPALPGYAAPGYAPPGMAWAPPETAYANPAALRFADVPARFVAWLLDGLLLGVASSVVLWALFAVVVGTDDWRALIGTGTGIPALDPDTVGRFALVSVASTVVNAVFSYVYFAFQWSSEGRATLGMRVLRLQVGNAADGRTIGLGQATRRWVAMGAWLSVVSFVPPFRGLVGLVQLGWYVVLLVSTASSPTRQGLHDRFADTAIVTRGPDDRLAAGCLVIVGIVVLLVLISIVALVLLGAQVSTILEDVGRSI